MVKARDLKKTRTRYNYAYYNTVLSAEILVHKMELDYKQHRIGSGKKLFRTCCFPPAFSFVITTVDNDEGIVVEIFPAFCVDNIILIKMNYTQREKGKVSMPTKVQFVDSNKSNE